MKLETNLQGRLRNTSLALTNVLFPLYEAVINSIHSIDSLCKNNKCTIDKTYIKIKILRKEKEDMFGDNNSDIMGFEITDNGVGFNDDNYISFQTLDSEFKKEIGCRGFGRLLWLKAFDIVVVNSIYLNANNYLTRDFEFNLENGIQNVVENITDNRELKTTVTLKNLHKQYLKYLPKTSQSIAKHLLEHCLWYFMREGGVPDISIHDNDGCVSLSKEYDEFMISSAVSEVFSIKGKEFTITHIKMKSEFLHKHKITFTAANRVVKDEYLQGKIAGLYNKLADEDEDFCYMGFLTSDYLDEKVRPERDDFNILLTDESIFADDEITFVEIRNQAIDLIANYLDKYLVEVRQRGKSRVIEYISQKAPRYRSIFERISEVDKYVDPDISDKELEIKLHGHLMQLEQELLEEGHDLLMPTEIENKEEYSEKIDQYLRKANDLKQSDLANYVMHRRVILDLLSAAILKNKEGKYARENVLHKLIMPMQTTTDHIRNEENNLWLIDERLAFHSYFASDKPINKMFVLENDSKLEPDLFGLNIYDNPLLVNDSNQLPLASITVIELKRPGRKEAKAGEGKDPIEQVLTYLETIRNGKVTSLSGRKIPDSTDIPGFCYIIADLTDSLKKKCKNASLRLTSDKLGYFGYNDNYKAYIEVISYDRLVNAAKERNRAFFDKLGLPTS